ncbi:hypothetical protein NC652_041733 [Populus alba x Populus x berolinensis]|nr:hypothetical protein NC652_041733 [Populus alba x Populus x berolinensis]
MLQLGHARPLILEEAALLLILKVAAHGDGSERTIAVAGWRRNLGQSDGGSRCCHVKRVCWSGCFSDGGRYRGNCWSALVFSRRGNGGWLADELAVEDDGNIGSYWSQAVGAQG